MASTIPIETAIRMRSRGYTYKDIGEQFGLTGDAAYRLLKKYGHSGRVCIKCGKKLDRGILCDDHRIVIYRDNSTGHDHYAGIVAQRVCPRCLRQCDDDTHRVCSICRIQIGKAAKIMRDARRSAGLCTECGNPRDVNGHLRCSACLARDRGRYKARRPRVV